MRMLTLFNSGLLAFSFALATDGYGYAHCARCEQIEAKRAKELAENPQPWRYYDDYVSLSDHDRSSNSDSSYHQTTKRTTDDSSISLNEHSDQESWIDEEASLEDRLEGPTYTSQGDTGKPREQATLIEEEFMQENFTAPQQTAPSLPSSTRQRSPFIASQTFSTLFTILHTKNFLSVMAGPFTLFVPTNEAIRQLPPLLFQDLKRPENQAHLSEIVSTHVVAKQLFSQDFNGQEVKTISGNNLVLRNENGKLTVSGARILRAEPAGNNGVLYIIDRVLLPNL